MWLLETAVRQLILNAEAAGTLPTLDDQVKFEARYSAEDEDGSPRLLKTAGNVGEITIRGVLTQSPSFMAMLFGGGNTTYSEIVSAIAVAEQDPSVEKIVYNIDSPGGQVEGLFELLAAQQAAKKPSVAVVSKAASAAYAIAAQADTIEAVNRASMVGSIGVKVDLKVAESVVSIASTEAPNKNPDPTTAEGKAVYVEFLDSMHQLFAESIAEGRGTTVENVNAEFGQGATLLADEAIKRGMIDSIASAAPSPAVTNKTSVAASADTHREVKAMTLEELKASHPDAYAAAVALGNGQGVTQERDRIAAHLTMGEASGDMKTAMTAITDGSLMTSALQATYMAAGMNKASVDNRSAEEIEAAAALENLGQDDPEAKDTAASAKLTSSVFAACGAELGVSA